MKKLKLNYREVVELLELMQELQDILGLEQIPHYTTVHKFFQRFSPFMFALLLAQTARLFELSGIIAIDSTGFSSNYSSRYYMMIRYRQTKGVWSASYIKNSAAVDLVNQVILGNKCRNDHRHDSLDFNAVLKRAVKTGKVTKVIADRGYDFERVHKFARNVMKVDTLIPVRDMRRRKVHGRYRKMLFREFDRETYNQRNKAETVFSVVKRKFGDTMRSRSWRLQKKEVKLVCAAYNIHRYVVCFIELEVFYKTV
jgi:transposase